MIPRIGRLRFSDENLDRIARSMTTPNHARVAGSPMYRQLGSMFLLDYLTFNEDRSHNLGTLRASDGPPFLVLFDHGAALRRARWDDRSAAARFQTVELFPRETVRALRTIDEARLRELLTAPRPGASVGAREIAEVARRREMLLRRVDELCALHGEPRVLY
jgi:hypothetical protein